MRAGYSSTLSTRGQFRGGGSPKKLSAALQMCGCCAILALASRVGALPLMLRCETYQVYHGSNAGAMMNIWQFVWAMLTGVL
eukprot:scaffold2846_cov322-Pavlova_lutheri.AAC.25